MFRDACYRKDKGMTLAEKFEAHLKEAYSGEAHMFTAGELHEMKRLFYAGAEAALWVGDLSAIRMGAEIDHFKSRPGAK